MLRPYTFRSAPTSTERMLSFTEPMRSLRPAARPSAAVAAVPAPAPAPISPVARSRPAAAVTTAWRTRGTPPTAPTTTATAAPLRSGPPRVTRSEEHTSELQSHHDLVCRLLLEKKKNTLTRTDYFT